MKDSPASTYLLISLIDHLHDAGLIDTDGVHQVFAGAVGLAKSAGEPDALFDELVWAETAIMTAPGHAALTLPTEGAQKEMMVRAGIVRNMTKSAELQATLHTPMNALEREQILETIRWHDDQAAELMMLLADERPDAGEPQGNA